MDNNQPTTQRPEFPFTAIVGQDELKLALLLNAVDPTVGGLLIRGSKGTGKSTAVRSLTDILPEIETVRGCKFNCDPNDPLSMCPVCRENMSEGKSVERETKRVRIVNLPIGATEDRVIGSLDVERVIKDGIRALQPGLLAEANRNILYIDEVNLLPDYVTDSILDAAASGWNVVEREGISVTHPSRFTLIGTMNPEEGELRPQLLDRFALHIVVEGVYEADQRSEIIKHSIEYSEDPKGFIERSRDAQEKLKKNVLSAKSLIRKVQVPPSIIRATAEACIKLRVDGHRPDIATIKAAKALAAFEGRDVVTPSDVKRVNVMAVGFRTRASGHEDPPKPEEIREAFENSLSKAEKP